LLDLFEASNNLSTLKLVLHVGSGEEYGNILAPMKETDREYPNSPYALSKQLTTNTAIMLNKNFSFPIAVVRPCNLYGKYQSSEKFFPYLINRLLQNQEIITTPGQQKRDFMYVRDFVMAIDSMFNGYKEFIGEIFNVSSGYSESIQDIILECRRYIKSESVVKFGKIPYKQDEIMHFELDNTKFFQRTGKIFAYDNQQSRREYIDSFSKSKQVGIVSEFKHLD
jgi:UDP-glucose 4-epimerase